jgi:hypothetical protein
VLIAGAASTTGASHLLLKLAELGVLEGFTTRLAQAEAERNVQFKLAHALPVLRGLVREAVEVVDNPSLSECASFSSQAETEDVPHLAAAVREACRFLVTFNTRHYWPKIQGLEVIKPGDLLRRLRLQIASLEPSSDAQAADSSGLA